MTAIFFALVSYVGWGSGDVFSAKASRKVGAFQSSFWTYVFGFLLLNILAPFFLADLARFNFQIVIINIALGILLWSAWPIFLQALRIGNASVVGTIAGAFGGPVVILSTIFLKESLILIQIIAISVILFGIILSSLSLKELGKKSIENKGTVLAILVMLIWGVYFTFVRIPTDEIGWFWTSYISSATGTAISIFLAIIKKQKVTKVPKKQYFNLFSSSALVGSASASYNFALTQGLTSIVAPIATAYPTLFVLLSRIVFKDKLTRQQWLSIVVGLAGIVILAISS